MAGHWAAAIFKPYPKSNPLKKFLPYLAAALLFCSCNKAIDELVEDTLTNKLQKEMAPGTETAYLIKAGGHSCTGNAFVPVSVTELKFTARFDSSAVYATALPLNQLDINKLYGFSDNSAMHHEYSARFGWRWSDGALRLFAYVYNAGKVESEEISTVAIGKEISCALRVKEGQYEFQVGDKLLLMPRASTTPVGKGYLLFPYFGGDETAPHDIRIWIKNQ